MVLGDIWPFKGGEIALASPALFAPVPRSIACALSPSPSAERAISAPSNSSARSSNAWRADMLLVGLTVLFGLSKGGGDLQELPLMGTPPV